MNVNAKLENNTDSGAVTSLPPLNVVTCDSRAFSAHFATTLHVWCYNHSLESTVLSAELVSTRVEHLKTYVAPKKNATVMLLGSLDLC